jgi:DNA polymerase-3 subunit epsilon
LNKSSESFADLDNHIKCPIEISKPLIFLDIEATGPDPQADRIIEIHVIRFEPDGSKKSFYATVNPTESIPVESTKIHGFTNKDLSQSPAFKKIANDLYDIVKDADVGGYNVLRFDVRILFNEFKRVNITYDLSEIRAIDPFQIFIKNHKRDLASAYQFYCNKELIGAHGAKADNLATLEIFM